MTSPDHQFRTRTFVAVPPGERPLKQRQAVRVLVVSSRDQDTRVLLFADSDPGVPGSRWWVTPGGGIDPGESTLQAAVRELEEETGLQASPDDLVGPVMRRRARHGYSDQILEQDEEFFILWTATFEVDTAGHTEDEKVTLTEARWIPVDELVALEHPVWPDCIPALLGLATQPEFWPWEMGSVEESTVPV